MTLSVQLSSSQITSAVEINPKNYGFEKYIQVEKQGNRETNSLGNADTESKQECIAYQLTASVVD